MTKHLRLIMLSLLAMICLGGYSQSDELYKTLSFPDENSNNTNKNNNNYSSVWIAKIGTDSWRIANFNNNNFLLCCRFTLGFCNLFNHTSEVGNR